MSNGNIIPGLVPIAHSPMQEDMSSISGLPYITSVVVYFPLDIYEPLVAALGGPINLMQVNALLPSYVDVQVNNGTTDTHYRERISHILPAQNHFPDAVFNDRLSPQDAGVAAQFYENTYPPYQAPSPMRWEHVTTSLDTGYPDFESALGDLNDQAAFQVHYPVLSQELPSTIRSILPSTSSSTATFPFSAQPPFLGGSATLPNISSADRQVSHHSEHEIQSPHGHQIQQPGSPRAYVADGLLVDEEDLKGGNTNDDRIHVHACNREDSLCGLWVKADRRSIVNYLPLVRLQQADASERHTTAYFERSLWCNVDLQGHGMLKGFQPSRFL
ncbi:hypothetical protein EV702DRAFT_1195755 [Suillus placidus]|uniref:Uncharacterized protein n=1 Tax=Suillus placidus TaxID=48579 RepID=A0A9P6ZY48_9AGAM|nr:hypothetical protein EV702DRAFT_1195755 [Suillus placidus]